MEEAWRMVEVLLVFRFEETWTRPSDDEKKPEGGKLEPEGGEQMSHWSNTFLEGSGVIQEHCGDTGRVNHPPGPQGGRIWVQINVWVGGRVQESMLGHLILSVKREWDTSRTELGEHRKMTKLWHGEERKRQWNRQGWLEALGVSWDGISLSVHLMYALSQLCVCL